MATTKGTQAEEKQTAQPQGAQGQPQQPQAQPQPQQAAIQRREERAMARPGFPAFGPFTLMRRLFDDIESLLGVGEPRAAEQLAQTFVPAIDVDRRGDKLVVHADLPGMAASDISITVTDDALILEGERRAEREAQEGGVWRTERAYGRFRRAIPLPDNADTDNVEARFENGVLEISVRAPEKTERGRKVEINKPGEQKGSREAH